MEKLRLAHRAICVPRSQRPGTDQAGEGLLTWLELFPQGPLRLCLWPVGGGDRARRLTRLQLRSKAQSRSLSRVAGESLGALASLPSESIYLKPLG